MGGGLMQLVAYGAQDVYLTGSPQITFFKLVYRRHTNFAIESIEQVFHGTPSWGQKATVTVSRNGDLVTDMFLQITLPAVNARATRHDELYDGELAKTVVGPWGIDDFKTVEIADEPGVYHFLDADGTVLTYSEEPLGEENYRSDDQAWTVAITSETTTWAQLREIVPGLMLSDTRDHTTRLIRGPFDPTLFRHKYDAVTEKHVLVKKNEVDYVTDRNNQRVTLDPDSAFVTTCEDPDTSLFAILYDPDYEGAVYEGPLHSYQYANSLGHHLVEACEIEIGGQRIDKHYGEYYEVWDELRTPETKRVGYGRMVGKQYHPTTGAVWDRNVDVSDLSKRPQLDADMGHTGPVTLYVPLRFWFNGNAGLALPLIALQYHEVKLQFSLTAFDASRAYRSRLPPARTYGNVSSTPVDPSVALWVDYVYLDTEERRRFAQASHEYLIEQLQFTGSESIELRPNSETMHKVRLNFNHPTKELIWCVRSTEATAGATPFNFGESTVDERLLSTGSDAIMYGYEYVRGAKILLNGHDRFAERDGSYFRLVVPYLAHTCVPKRHVYCYAFALRPEDHQCSGSLNMSRIDNASIHLRLAPSSVPERNESTGEIALDDDGEKKFVKEAVRLNVYAVSYNILRIVSGMGGLAYSN